MKPPAASPGRAEKQLPAPPGLARLLLSKSRRGGGRSRRAPATSPMFVSRSRGAGRAAAAAADGEPSSPKVTCIGQVRMRKGKKGKKKAAAAAAAKVAAPEKGRGYCRCLKKAFLCGGLFDFDRRRRPKAPSPEVVERTRRSPWVFSSRDVSVAVAPKQPDPRGEHGEEDDEMEASARVFGSLGGEEAEEIGINGGGGGGDREEEEEEEAAELVSSATTTPPKNALLLMRCRSAPQNRSSPLTSRFPVVAPSPTKDAAAAASSRASPSPRKAQKPAAEGQHVHDGRQQEMAAVQEQDEAAREQEPTDDDDDESDEEEDMRCSSARPLVLPRCKSEPATTAAAKMAAAGGAAEAATSGCFWANGGSSGRRRHAPPAAAPPVALTGH
ncbi:uncharacterized protein LOC121054504 [Oryza brachyantha]|uniref:uncharacterized protein LOC121054504 n=1 Tax=Oryza brachyantha TaxID=4533 RepID=UPI001ADB67AD|nr:uncharacterized protein LOC121054504 [Oryza brachyantha]